MHKVLIERDEDNEMMRISIDGVVYTEGNYWDIDPDVWVSVLRKVGVRTIEGGYEYE